MKGPLLVLAAVLSGGSACGGDSGGSNGQDGGGAFMAIAPCSSQGSYSTGSAISTSGSSYSPSCLRVSAGTSVTIAASTTHPLAPRTGGTGNNPIPSQSSPASVTFPTPGFYPFHCTVHQPTMAGVVWVE